MKKNYGILTMPNYDNVARAGSYVFEPPGETHTLMVDADVGLNELIDAGLIEVVELIQSGPGGKGNAAVHVGVRREDQMDIFFVGLRALLVFQQDAFKLFDEVGASFGALVINDDSAVLEVVDKIFFGNDLIVGAPGRNAGHVRSGGRGLAVIRRVWIAQSLNMHIAQVRNVLAGRFPGWSGGSTAGGSIH